MFNNWALSSRLIETIVVFECFLFLGIVQLFLWLIETIVVFELLANKQCGAYGLRLIETIVVFE